MSMVYSTSDFNEFTFLSGFLNPFWFYLLQETFLVLIQHLHIETDGSLSLCLGTIVRHGDGISMPMLGGNAGNKQAGLLGIINRMRE